MPRFRTARDNEIIHAAEICTNGLDLKSIAETWWPNSRDAKRDAEKRLDTLCAGTHPELRKRRGWCLSIPPVVKPVWSKPAGERIKLRNIDTYHIANELQSRWNRSELVELTVYVASQYAARRLGGPLRQLADLTDWSHDLHMSRVYLHYRKHRPHDAQNWLHEDCYAAGVHTREGEKLPDAVIVDPDTGLWRRIVEGGGSYPEQRVRAFLEYWSRNGTDLDVELW